MPVVAVKAVPGEQKRKAWVALLPLANGCLKLHPALLHSATMFLSANSCHGAAHHPCFGNSQMSCSHAWDAKQPARAG